GARPRPADRAQPPSILASPGIHSQLLRAEPRGTGPSGRLERVSHACVRAAARSCDASVACRYGRSAGLRAHRPVRALQATYRPPSPRRSTRDDLARTPATAVEEVSRTIARIRSQPGNDDASDVAAVALAEVLSPSSDNVDLQEVLARCAAA